MPCEMLFDKFSAKLGLQPGYVPLFVLCEWRGKERQQFHRRLVFISQSMFKSDRYRDYLSIFDRDLRLI